MGLYDDLFAQHRVAEGILDRIRKAGAALAAEELTEGLALLRKDAEYHFGLEENILFPILNRYGKEDLLEAFLEDHVEFWKAMEKAEKGLRGLQAGDSKATGLIKEGVDAILDILPAHIEKEDNVLFPMAKEVMTAAEWREAESKVPPGP